MKQVLDHHILLLVYLHLYCSTDRWIYDKSPIDATKKFTFSGAYLVEKSLVTREPDEDRTYVNDAGAEIQIPFKDGEILTGLTT